jgi:hypothetical protein
MLSQNNSTLNQDLLSFPAQDDTLGGAFACLPFAWDDRYKPDIFDLFDYLESHLVSVVMPTFAEADLMGFFE